MRFTLATKIVEKLVFIKLNLTAFYNYLAPDDDIIEYNSESNNDVTTTLDDSAPKDAMESDDEDVVSM